MFTDLYWAQQCCPKSSGYGDSNLNRNITRALKLDCLKRKVAQSLQLTKELEQGTIMPCLVLTIAVSVNIVVLNQGYFLTFMLNI